ncbi:HNH endonuclease [Campylobacter fetus subsp. venerealis]|uniref:RNA-guided endonuclease IscB n=1 Tax=Campylobacter fetus TaxID=196 RepID=UPI0003D91F0E|nr:RNA-guided endonuclease IscB [Campylobacter fetus]AHE95216.1 HNH endonuclease [Campylobacter fetus subsp. venerealis cfvi03/293]KAA3682631.1 HNH endonuclease [Campylobacter fetus subsp. venerealis]
MVLVIDKHKHPCNAISKAYARILLHSKQAVIHRQYPFTIRLKNNNAVKKDTTYVIKIDPGASVTGISIVDNSNNVIMFAELIHRGKVIKRNLDSRRAVRRSRRQRKTRYRPARFQNRTKPQSWLAPSVKSRADNVINFVRKLKRFLNINKVEIERVSFDTAQMSSEKPLYGSDYQQGTLYQTELRSYLFKKYNCRCIYCGNKAEEIEHVIPKSKGGTNSVHNLVIACRKCNELKDKLSLKEFGKLVGKDFSHLEPKKLPKYAAIVQSARNYMFQEIIKIVPDTASYDAWLTKYNREELELPKQHYYDALSVGEINNYKFLTDKVLIISAKGRGSRQMCRMDSYGFPRTSAKAFKSVKGFQTGDIVKAIVPTGLKQGEYLGRVAVRVNGYFNITTQDGSTQQGVGYKFCRLLQRNDGYSYNYKERDFLSAMNCRVSVANF